jgi:hypothetical protein
MSHSMRKVPYHDHNGQDGARRDRHLFVYHHNTSGVSQVFDELGKEVFGWSDNDGNLTERLGNILLGKEDEGPLAEFEDGELEQLKKWMWGSREITNEDRKSSIIQAIDHLAPENTEGE